MTGDERYQPSQARMEKSLALLKDIFQLKKILQQHFVRSVNDLSLFRAQGKKVTLNES